MTKEGILLEVQALIDGDNYTYISNKMSIEGVVDLNIMLASPDVEITVRGYAKCLPSSKLSEPFKEKLTDIFSDVYFISIGQKNYIFTSEIQQD